MPPRTAALTAGALAQNRLLADGSNWIAFKLRVRGLLASVWRTIDRDAATKVENAASASAAASSTGGDKKKIQSTAETAADAAADSEYACGMLAQLLPDEMLLMVQAEMDSQDAAAVWKKLTAHFERKTTASRTRTRKQLHSVRMQFGEQFDFYKARVMSLAMQLKGMGETVTESEIVFALMNGLPSYYAAARDSLEMQNDLTVDVVSDKLRDVMERREMQRDEEEEQANFAGGRGGYGGRGGGRGAGRGGLNRGGRGGLKSYDGRTAAGDYKNGNKQQMRDDEPMDEGQHRCALCRARGHWERFCPHRRGDGYSCYRCGMSDHQLRDCKTDLQKAPKEEANFIGGAYEYDDEDCMY
jgi:hypothetical protein